MRELALGALIVAGCTAAAMAVLNCCHTIPPYTPPQVPSADDIRVYNALVEAGCMSPDEGGAGSLDQAHARVDQPAWMACMYRDGGTVSSCGVPCQ